MHVNGKQTYGKFIVKKETITPFSQGTLHHMRLHEVKHPMRLRKHQGNNLRCAG